MRHPLVIGNWKLNGNENTIIESFTILNDKLTDVSLCNIAIAPPLVYLNTAKHYLSNNNIIKLCAQNVDIHLSGSFTGDISALMLKDLGVKYVLIGHSERRRYHQENDLYIAKKFSILKKTGLIPILCIGENKTEYDAGHTQTVCIKQIDSIIKLLGIQAFENSVIAYEPVWSIGTGISANPNHVQFIHKFIRNYIAQYDTSIADQLIIQYGGSVNPNNITQFMFHKDIDGVLVGNSSLNINTFLTIIRIVSKNL